MFLHGLILLLHRWSSKNQPLTLVPWAQGSISLHVSVSCFTGLNVVPPDPHRSPATLAPGGHGLTLVRRDPIPRKVNLSVSGGFAGMPLPSTPGPEFADPNLGMFVNHLLLVKIGIVECL